MYSSIPSRGSQYPKVNLPGGGALVGKDGKTLAGLYSNNKNGRPDPTCDEFPPNAFLIPWSNNDIQTHYQGVKKVVEQQDLRCISGDDNFGSGSMYGLWCADELGPQCKNSGFWFGFTGESWITQCNKSPLNCANNPAAQFWWGGYNANGQNKIKGAYYDSVYTKDNTKQAHGISKRDIWEEPKEIIITLKKRYLRSDGETVSVMGPEEDLPDLQIGSAVITGNGTVLTIVQQLETETLESWW
ncbi:MAG: hypothetical protein Q9227_002775 [Pyrenula ochraceoflavens]